MSLNRCEPVSAYPSLFNECARAMSEWTGRFARGRDASGLGSMGPKAEAGPLQTQASIVAATALLMTSCEAVKQALWPDLPSWHSQALTIAFASLVAGAVSHFAIPSYARVRRIALEAPGARRQRSEAAAAAAGRADGGAATVLVVEDEPGLRSLIRETLEASGYRTLVARHGGEAVRVVREHDSPIDLLITRVIVPGAGGSIAAEAIRMERPAIKVLLVSGHGLEAENRHGAPDSTGLLRTPFGSDGLLRKVEALLDGR